MQEIPRAILLPPPSQLAQRTSARALQIDSDSAVEATRSTRRQSPGATQALLTLIDSRREDTVEIRGKQFRFRPYNSRGAPDGGARETVHAGEANPGGVGIEARDGDASVDVLDGFGGGAHERNSSAFVASLIAQEHLRQGLHNPRFEAASDAYRRAGGSPSAVDNQPRVLSFAV